ncbi:MAG: hypothetical protein NVS1B11_21290 [Terriglobales bacterium]
MPVLAYCITEAAEPIQILQNGVAGRQINSILHRGLKCSVAHLEEREAGPNLASREEALAFHRVLQEILGQTTVIPFRFPTFFENQNAVSSHLNDNNEQYHEALSRLHGKIQMEVHITLRDATGARQVPLDGQAQLSGTEYLRARQQAQQKLVRSADKIREAVEVHMKDWRLRSSAREIRAFALVERKSLEEFRRALARATIGAEFEARASGPWPATEFLEMALPLTSAKTGVRVDR